MVQNVLWQIVILRFMELGKQPSFIRWFDFFHRQPSSPLRLVGQISGQVCEALCSRQLLQLVIGCYQAVSRTDAVSVTKKQALFNYLF